tara:strand:+ start:52 stop:558 length:507 start_codon:yes stop_codon:yes gene_type:complete
MRLYTLIILLGASLLNAEEIPSDVVSLTGKRDAAVEKIDAKYKSELEKLKLAYMKKGDLDSANTIEKIVKDVEVSVSDLEKDFSIVGEWKVIDRNEDRRFHFTKDKKFKGHFLKAGETFEGKWEIEDNTIQLFDPDKKMMPQKLMINSSDQIIFLTPSGYATLERTGE